jgi:hypothetical protein
VSLEVSFADPEGSALGFCELGPRFDSGTESAALFLEGEAASDGDFRVSSEGDDQVRVEAEGWGFELELAARGEPIEFGPDTEAGALSGVTLEIAAVRVSGRIWSAKGERRIDYPGVTRRADGSVDWRQTSLLRLIAVPFEKGGILALAAARPARAEGHGQEGVTGALVEPDGSVSEPVETLLSTQYDSAGDPVRAGLELSLSSEHESPPLRGAASRLWGTRIEGSEAGVATAFMRWELEGRTGVGRYDIVGRG